MATSGVCLQRGAIGHRVRHNCRHPGFRHSASKTRVNALMAQSGLLTVIVGARRPMSEIGPNPEVEQAIIQSLRRLRDHFFASITSS